MPSRSRMVNFGELLAHEPAAAVCRRRAHNFRAVYLKRDALIKDSAVLSVRQFCRRPSVPSLFAPRPYAPR